LARPVPRFKVIEPLAETVQRGGRAVVKTAIEATPDLVKAIRVQVTGRETSDVTPDVGSGGSALPIILGSGPPLITPISSPTR
jgi:hypothetical protein